MTQRAQCPPRKLLVPVLITALLAISAGLASAQAVDPTWDHYKAYRPDPMLTHPELVTLADQFGTTTHHVSGLEWFANPVEKVHSDITYRINHPELHYTWWMIDQLPFSGSIIASNQFGDYPLELGPIVALLNPANKNELAGAPLPIANHYKVYICFGDPIPVGLVLTDQFYTRSASILIPQYFCVPTEKQTSSGQLNPILDDMQHYVVYGIESGFQTFTAVISDQFIQDVPVALSNDALLMVPTIKHLPPTETKSSTWGRIKQLFR